MYVPMTPYPEIPPHDCPGRTVTCPDCGQTIPVSPPVRVTWVYLYLGTAGAGGPHTTSLASAGYAS